MTLGVQSTASAGDRMTFRGCQPSRYHDPGIDTTTTASDTTTRRIDVDHQTRAKDQTQDALSSFAADRSALVEMRRHAFETGPPFCFSAVPPTQISTRCHALSHPTRQYGTHRHTHWQYDLHQDGKVSPSKRAVATIEGHAEAFESPTTSASDVKHRIPPALLTHPRQPIAM